jgi:regulatory protein
MAGARRPREVTHPLDCHERALRLLSVRQRSRHELEDRLLRVGFEAEEVRAELDRLAEVGLVDDRRFAREFAEHELRVRLVGRRAVASALAGRGIDRTTIEEALEGCASDDPAAAGALARSRARRLAGVPAEKAFPRLVSFLVRRGHAPETARRAAREALTLDVEASEP